MTHTRHGRDKVRPKHRTKVGPTVAWSLQHVIIEDDSLVGIIRIRGEALERVKHYARHIQPCFKKGSLLPRWKCRRRRRRRIRRRRIGRRRICGRWGRRRRSLTCRTLKTSTGTVACESIDSIDTSTTIGTTRRRAIVDICLTSVAGEASAETFACESLDSIDTRTTIGTTCRRAIVNVGLTIGACEASTSTQASVP